MADANGCPLAATLTGANRHNVTQLVPLVAAVPPVRGRAGRPRRRPRVVLGDRGYDHDKYRRLLRRLFRVASRIARRGEPHGSGLGRQRWVIERTIAWLHGFRRLRTRWERTASMHAAFLELGCCVICWRLLRRLC